MAWVLVVDDLELVRDICARLLLKAGHDVVQAATGDDALRLYRDFQPDCVLLDVSMPGLDGLATLQALRTIDPTARIAMLTSHNDRAIVESAIALGARDYVAKPFQRERLIAAVQRLAGP